MNLQDIKGSYDAIVSLGSICWPAIHLKRHNLRRFSSPLDWVLSASLSDVNRLLKNKFNGFMELENMHLMDADATVFFIKDNGATLPTKTHLIRDAYYNIVSAHDFPILQNKDWTVSYSSYKRKLNYRINRFLKKLTSSQSVLFVRWASNHDQYDQVVELQSILSGITKGKFNILILHPVEGLQNISEMNLGIDGVCSVQVPSDFTSNSTWDYILNGITLTK